LAILTVNNTSNTNATHHKKRPHYFFVGFFRKVETFEPFLLLLTVSAKKEKTKKKIAMMNQFKQELRESKKEKRSKD
jgi:hypothetical protein